MKKINMLKKIVDFIPVMIILVGFVLAFVLLAQVVIYTNSDEPVERIAIYEYKDCHFVTDTQEYWCKQNEVNNNKKIRCD